jgi:hypothetical protein
MSKVKTPKKKKNIVPARQKYSHQSATIPKDLSLCGKKENYQNALFENGCLGGPYAVGAWCHGGFPN